MGFDSKEGRHYNIYFFHLLLFAFTQRHGYGSTLSYGIHMDSLRTRTLRIAKWADMLRGRMARAHVSEDLPYLVSFADRTQSFTTHCIQHPGVFNFYCLHVGARDS
jgi:hypothetical protein